jgi:hypothetical protein
MTIKFEAQPIKVETLRKSSFSETTKYHFADMFDAVAFFASVNVCVFIGEWKRIETDNTVTVFNCSAD